MKKGILATLVAASLLLAASTIGVAAEKEDKKSSGYWDTKKSAWTALSPAQRDQVFKFADDYKAYLATARTAETSTREVIRLAKAAGFAEFKEFGQVKAGARLYVNGRDRAVILVVVGSDPMVSGTRLVGTHHDSPHIDLKARPFRSAGGFALFNTAYYGGIKKYQWANRPLALVGRIDTPDGKRTEVAIGLKDGDPLFVIPDNAPHSDKMLRDRKYTDVFTGEELAPVVGSIPGADSSVVDQVVAALTSTYGVREEDFASAELALVPAARPADVGIDRGLVGSAGQDDRLSSYCAVRAMLDLSGTPKKTALAYLSNFEEVGSDNNTGAKSQFFNSTLARLVGAERGAKYTDLDLREALQKSEVISADVNDGINPIFPQTSDPGNSARVGYGVTIKRYGAGFDANSEFAAKIRGILERNGIAWQTQSPKEGYSGGTIGGFLSEWDMEVIDLGVPLLSMHSPYEMSSKVDVWSFYRFMNVFLGSS
ncbi:MAG TPA: peptidase M18 [Thermoanaerobaculia bacterium]|jgi:aspartyl aminopeptidase